MDGHIVREKDISEICPYCSRNVNQKAWDSDFEIHTHYRLVKCDCGKKVSVKRDVITSGEAWDDCVIHPPEHPVHGKATTLENRVIIVKEHEFKYITTQENV